MLLLFLKILAKLASLLKSR